MIKPTKFFRTALIWLLSALIFISCEKEEDNVIDSSNPFIGSWKIEYNADMWDLAIFNEDLSYEYEHHELNPDYNQYDTGIYSFSLSENTITFTENGSTWSEDFEFTNSTTLVMSGDVYIKQ